MHAANVDLSPEDYFHREWVRWMFTMSVDTLREKCEASGRMVHFQLFEAYDLRDDDNTTISYASLAKTFDLDPATVNNYLAATRRDFRRIVSTSCARSPRRTMSFARKHARCSEPR